MKKVPFLLFNFLIVLGLVACGSDSANEDSSKAEANVAEKDETSVNEPETNNLSDKSDVEAYLDEVREYYLELNVLGERWDELREASAAGEIDDYELGDIINDEIIPLNMELLEGIEDIYTANDEVADVNEILIEAIGNQQLAFTEILSAIETGDSSKITSANALLNDVRKGDREFSRGIEKLMIDHDID